MYRRSTQEVMQNDPSSTFVGVRFVLCGFDPIKQEQFQLKLLDGGGLDVGSYCPDCTHVIVDNIVYDDPICVSARTDGKVVVTSVWVDDCYVLGKLVDPTHILYRPLRDLNGIPGAESLIICLTGYIRGQRDYVMNLVGLMGATFSKPLVATQVTHLVCYKFEGEKYLLAKKLTNIKMVNHSWLEDCLKSWALLPETDYDLSGYEVEMMGAEAKDSEEEDIPAQSYVERNFVTTPHNLKSFHQSLSKQDCLNLTTSSIGTSPKNTKTLLRSFKKQYQSEDLNLSGSRTLSDENPKKISPAGNGSEPPGRLLKSDARASGTSCTKQTTPDKTKKTYSRKGQRKNSLVMEEVKREIVTPPSVNAGRDNKSQIVTSRDNKRDESSALPEKRNSATLSRSSKKLKETRAQGTEGLVAVHNANNAPIVPKKRSPVHIFNNDAPDTAKKLCSKETHETHFTETMEDVCTDVKRQEIKATSPASRKEGENSTEFTDQKVPKEARMSKPQSRKLGKESLSTKTEKYNKTSVKGPAKNQKGSIFQNTAEESAVNLTGGEKVKCNEDINSEKIEIPDLHDQDTICKASGESESLVSDADQTQDLFDNTEAPNDKGELHVAVLDDKPNYVESPHSVGEGNMCKTDNEARDKMVGQTDSMNNVTGLIKEMKDTTCTSSKTNQSVSIAKKPKQSKEGSTKKRVTSGKSKAVAHKQTNNFMEADKENMPSGVTREPTMDCEIQGEEKFTQGAHKKPCKANDREGQGNVIEGLSLSNMEHGVGGVTSLTYKVPNEGMGKSENRYFIVSGHRLQRKEFHMVIKRLRGRSCRDSHQWSYQATHFILPDPVRRTEKFFAAAASGRWILKVDYLTACNEAGKFLEEEPFEWHKKGLSDDLAISLEAPRKWRLLRERTGHGAFYGMRIVTYGELLLPSLDTLKRVVKAGDGTILATSPSYTRFLKSDIHFAIVGPGIPRQDVWVQEFLRHNIPCVSPDYLVEYVCKPGYSLDKHVQYNTHAWAEESIRKLANCLSEKIEDIPLEDDDDDGVSRKSSSTNQTSKSKSK
ncbi:unnamed protein product [Cuscuta epithymum]|uniref:BRCT domain-containing protein n=1 Tax=Cuscuta epithymum TaxID=186058 RepID=A0AAV0CUA7_9ASTE|nr:unnamed protein product [Cuscuta epithymum]